MVKALYPIIGPIPVSYFATSFSLNLPHSFLSSRSQNYIRYVWPSLPLPLRLSPPDHFQTSFSCFFWIYLHCEVYLMYSLEKPGKRHCVVSNMWYAFCLWTRKSADLVCGSIAFTSFSGTTVSCLNILQVMSEGGPQPQSIIHFSISNQTVAVVNRLGQVMAKAVGTAIIQGTIQAVSEDTGKVIVFSKVSS